MRLRHDAVAAATEWIAAAEDLARSIDGLVAAVGKINVEPKAGNSVHRKVEATSILRHTK